MEVVDFSDLCNRPRVSKLSENRLMLTATD